MALSKGIVINKHSLQIKQYSGQNVVTFKDIDLCHERPEGTASRNFRANKQHFVEGTDYFTITPDKYQLDEIRRFGIMSPKGGILITESGYLMLVKSFTDELSWNVQRMLVDSYFNYKETPYEYFDKHYGDIPVLTLLDIQQLTGIKTATANSYFRHYGVINEDYYFLTGQALRAFKKSYPKLSRPICNLLLVNNKGFKELCLFHGLKTEWPKSLAQQSEEQVSLANESFSKHLAEIKNQLAAMNTMIETLESLENCSQSPFSKECLSFLLKAFGYMAMSIADSTAKLKNSTSG